MSPAWVYGSRHIEDLALPKSLKSGNFTLAKAVIRWMSEYCFSFMESMLRHLDARAVDPSILGLARPVLR